MSASLSQVVGPSPLILWLYTPAQLTENLGAQKDRGGKRTLCDPAHIPSQDRIEPSAGLTERYNQRAERAEEKCWVDQWSRSPLHVIPHRGDYTENSKRRQENSAQGNTSDVCNNSNLSNLPCLIGTNPRYCIRCHCAASQFLFRETLRMAVAWGLVWAYSW